ncbi:hypothetical protein MTO96_004196 [Rhipicephalus appendiculatus]
MLATPPLLTHDSAAQLHEIAEQAASGAVCLATVGAASLATGPALQAPAVCILDTTGELPTTTAYTSDVLICGDRAAASGLQCAPLIEPQDVPLPQGSDSEDMDTTTTRKRWRPSEPGSDDEGASRKLQGHQRGRASASFVKGAETPSACCHPTRHSREQRPTSWNRACLHLCFAASSLRQINWRNFCRGSRCYYRDLCNFWVYPRRRRQPARCYFDRHTTVPPFPRTSRLAIAQTLYSMPGVKEMRVSTKKNIVAADAATPEWAERLLATSEIIGMPVIARLPAHRSQSSGVVQGVDGNYADDDLLANVSSEATAEEWPPSVRLPKWVSQSQTRQHLELRAARRRAELTPLRTKLPEHWTSFRRVDAVCWHHARRRRNQSWQGVCCSINSSPNGPRAWRLLTSLLLGPRAQRQVLSVAVHMGISAGSLAELLADQFAETPPVAMAQPPPAVVQSIPSSCHHA